jgi:hypothetical protein
MHRPRRALQARFLTILPRLQTHGAVCFRHLRCPDQKAEAVAEMVALAWQWFVRLARQGTDAARFPSALAAYAARAVRSGRRLCGQEPAQEALSPWAQQRHHFTVGRLPDCDTVATPYADALQDNTVSPIPDQVAFRLDFPAWLRTRTGRDRRLIAALALSERTSAVAVRFGLTPGRVSQLRREYREDWLRFCDALAEANRPPQRRG